MIKAVINNEEILKGVSQNKVQDFISPNEFVEYGSDLFFMLESVSSELPAGLVLSENQDVYMAIQAKLNNNSPKELLINEDVVFVKTDIFNEREIISIVYNSNLLKEDAEAVIVRKKEAFKDFFRFMRAENGVLNLIYDNSLLPLIKMVLETEYNLLFDVSGKEFSMTLLDAFSIKGEIETKAYDSLYLGNISVNDFHGEKELFSIPGIYLGQNIYIEEDSDEDSLLESVLDSMGEEKVTEYIVKAIENC